MDNFGLIFFSWISLFVWQIISVPFLIIALKSKLYDGGWAWGRLILWLVIGLIIWFLSHLGIPANTQIFLWILLSLFGFISLYLFNKKRLEIISFIKEKKAIILVEEGLFFFGFFLLSKIRSFNPDILDLEKFMDAGLMYSYLRSPILPLEDMWLAGERFNYYTFGHFLGSLIASFWNLSVDYAYNLLLGLLCGLILMQVFSLVANVVSDILSKKDKTKKTTNLVSTSAVIISGLIGAYLVVFASNSQPFWYLISNLSLSGYWYPDATRFIENTIHEFPSYSFVVSDLHAHVWSLPVVLLMMLVVWLWLRAMTLVQSKKDNQIQQIFTDNYIYYACVMGVLLGVLIMTSTWDAMIYSILLAFSGLILIAKNPKFLLKLIVSAFLVIIMAGIASSAWLLNFDSISEGVRWVEKRSSLHDLMVLWTGHFTMIIIAGSFFLHQLFVKKLKKDFINYAFMLAIILTAIVLLALPEIIYFKDIYPDHPRANTMFKLTFQSFVMMGVVVAMFFGFLHKKIFEKDLSILLKIIVVFFMIVVGFYPFISYKSYYGEFKTNKGLDGLGWLKLRHPDDYQAILWLRDNSENGDRVLEAVGESYTTHARVSTFTGLPTVLGWRVHEWLWRGGFDIPSQRTEEVRLMYELPLSKESLSLFESYEIKYIFIGDLERETYTNLSQDELLQMGEVVFQQNQTYVIRI